ncbi:MAG: RagB/SusD family nutrient uptake outer membrane protein [Chitinophaga sp.]|uniref:RagB/SusD family nutrient uptake outer membrane protein n=1 Tax=Chitinophaga sp. TaxID=1869181 RepID=UPI001B0050A0|nr:RagB/SusD family nutrient uptake outer membrane protein [Chitinophaga sp.]
MAPLSGLNKDAFRTEVWKERYWELCAEGKTWYDIVRTKQVFNPATGTFTPVIGYKMHSGVLK